MLKIRIKKFSIPRKITIPDFSFEYVIYFSCCAIVLFWVLHLNRNFITDNQNYIDYFFFNYLFDFVTRFQLATGISKILMPFSAEYIWLLYTSILSRIASPSGCVLITIFLSNLFLMLAFYKLRFPIILLMIWILLPTGLSAVGLAQIRQGFAFSIFLFLAVFLSRPLLGALIAALIHTTFFVPLAFILCFVFFKDRRLMLLFAVIFVCIVGIFVGNNYFSMIAGQRVLEYGVDSAGATSINYIFGLILIMIPTVWSMMVKRTWPPILVVHFGVCIWLMMSFFLFPIGTNRLGYYSSLFAVPLVTNVWVFSREIKLYSIFILLPFLIYNVYLGVGIGRYAVLQLPF